jgi:hypothetical protein
LAHGRPGRRCDRALRALDRDEVNRRFGRYLDWAGGLGLLERP